MKKGKKKHIVGEIVWSTEMIYNQAKKYKYRSDFEKFSRGAYMAASRRGLLDIACSHMILKNIKWTPELIIKEARLYDNMSDFIKGSGGAYTASYRRYNLRDDIQKMYAEAKLKRFTTSHLLSCALSCHKRSEFKKRFLSEYDYARKNQLLEHVCSHMLAVYNNWNYDSIKKVALAYTTKEEFKKNFSGALNAAYALNIVDDVCSHMENRTPTDGDAVYFWRIPNRNGF